jgi:peptidoglycan/LPS O-acetylase OafA/YrhL
MRRLFTIIALLLALLPMLALAQDGNGDGAELEPDTSVAMWGLIVGFAMPAVIAALNRKRWSSTAKGLCAFVCSLVAAAGTAFFAGDLANPSDYITAALVVFVGAIGSYRLWWQPSGIAPAIEAKTG